MIGPLKSCHGGVGAECDVGQVGKAPGHPEQIKASGKLQPQKDLESKSLISLNTASWNTQESTAF